MGSFTEEENGLECPEEKKTRRRICVYCGSRAGFSQDYADAAEALGKELVRRDIDLVYGGGGIGMMGVVSRTVYQNGGRVIGIIPKALVGEELTGRTVGTTIVVQSMHQRKAKMASLADCFIALPGGYGTLEELLEMVTWYHLGIHNKPIGVLNVNAYYDPLLQMFDRMVETGFLTSDHRRVVVSAATPSALVDELENYQHPEPAVSRQRWLISSKAFLECANDDSDGKEIDESNLSGGSGAAKSLARMSQHGAGHDSEFQRGSVCPTVIVMGLSNMSHSDETG